MKNLLIACETIKYEVEHVAKCVGFTADTIWMSSKLHSKPERLREELQKTIDENIDYDYIILGYGSCGNALVGLEATNGNLVFPITADCISMLLCDHEDFESIRTRTYFLTKGWIECDGGLSKEFKNSLKKYGARRTEMIFKEIFKHYEHLMFIDTDTHNIDECLEYSRKFAKNADLKLILEKGSLSLIEKMLTNKWDKDFQVIKPGEKILLEHFRGVETDLCNM